MAILNNSNAISTAGGYDINNSLRFRSSASAYLSRTPASAPTDGKKLTLSCWIKRGILTGNYYIMQSGAGTGNDNYSGFYFQSNNTLVVSMYSVTPRITTQVFRDASAWYHLVLAYDTTQATADDRVKLYVNGTQVTAFTTNGTIPLNTLIAFTKQSQAVYIGTASDEATYYDGYMTEVNLIDGQTLTPSSFGETDTITGSWVAKKYTGTYGTNGFYLKFSDIATTSGSNAGLGKDFSGNANYWNTNNISVTAGTTYDAMIDSPTLTSATVANYAVLNPVDKSSNQTFAQANLYLSAQSGAGIGRASMAYPSTGKWYLEWTYGSLYNNIGISTSTTVVSTSYCGAASTTWGYYNGDGKIYNNASGTTYGATWTTGDVIGVAFDSDAGTLTFYKNNVSQGTAVSGLTPSTIQYFFTFGNDSGMTGYANFGQRPFTYTPPTGFVRLNTYNLPDSTIKKGNTVMDATLWTGNGTSQTIVNAGAFRPDLVWIKQRSSTEQNQLMDSVRGSSKVLNSNQTNAESTDATKLTAFNSNGFSVGSELAVNRSGFTYVGWQWQAGQGTTSNIAINQYGSTPSIASTVSVNATAGFSVVTYTGNGTAGATVGHGLGVAPKMFIVKNRVQGTYGNWNVWHTTLTGSQYLTLNTTEAAGTNNNRWNGTVPTSTVFSLGADSFGNTNKSGDTYVAYCWADVPGYSKAFSYTGNGSTDGVFVYLGFRPKFVLLKGSSGVNDWYIHDSTRNTYNVVDLRLEPNSSLAEVQSAVTVLDFLSNGFKLRTSNGGWNGSGSTYIGMAFAENPLKNSNAR
jgi:hypothetical protein